MEVERYTFPLCEPFKTIALRDLREDDAIRNQCLEQMIDWIQKHPCIKSCRTDAKFLLAFLRKNKFSILETRTFLEEFLKFRETNMLWFENLTLKDPEIEAMIDTGYNLPLGKDKNGRFYVWHRTGCVNPNTFTVEKSMRAMALMFQTILHNEEVQVGGITVIIDHAGLTWSHSKLATIFELRDMLGSAKVTPLRVKDVYMVNIPTFIQSVVELLDPFIARLFNMEKRKFFKDWDELKQVIDETLLPEEVGGPVSIENLIKNFKQQIIDMEDDIRSLPPIIYDRPREHKSWQSVTEDPLSGSFRKLEID